MLPHHLREAGQFLNAYRPLVQRHQHAHDVRRLHAPGEQFLHERFRLTARQRSPRFDLFDEQIFHATTITYSDLVTFSRISMPITLYRAKGSIPSQSSGILLCKPAGVSWAFSSAVIIAATSYFSKTGRTVSGVITFRLIRASSS